MCLKYKIYGQKYNYFSFFTGNHSGSISTNNAAIHLSLCIFEENSRIMQQIDMTFEILDFNNPLQVKAFLQLMNEYIADPMGGDDPLDSEKQDKLLDGLKQHKENFILLGKNENKYISLATCFWGFSTFHVKRLLNIHDLVVSGSQRNKGIGRIMLRKIAEIAKENDCCKITLEVRNDNNRAQHLYASEGYTEHNPPLYFWSKNLE